MIPTKRGSNYIAQRSWRLQIRRIQPRCPTDHTAIRQDRNTAFSRISGRGNAHDITKLDAILLWHWPTDYAPTLCQRGTTHVPCCDCNDVFQVKWWPNRSFLS